MMYARTRGYSLIEVLIATTVLSLGVLGLTAVLAGTAAQQEAAARQNQSVGVSLSAETTLVASLGRLDQARLSCSGFGVQLAEGTWYAVPMDLDNFNLDIAPLSFKVEADGLVLYDVNDHPSQQDVWVQGGGTNLATVPQDLIDPLPHAMISRSPNVVFRVTSRIIEPQFRNDPSAWPDPEERYVFSLAGINTTPPLDFPCGNSRVYTMPADGDGNEGVGSSLRFDTANDSGIGDTETAEIDNIQLRVKAQFGELERIERITIDPYEWENSTLVSINDRVNYEFDDDYPRDRRPSIAYTVLYRLRGSSAQVCLITYSMRPLSAPREVLSTGLAYIPPESNDERLNDEGVLREAPVDLGYDPDLDQYYIEIDAALEDLYGWAVEPGQILLMSSREGTLNVTSGSPQVDTLGADGAVRVRTSRRLSGATPVIRGILDEGPRIGGRAPLDRLDNPALREQIYVWGVQPVVRGHLSDVEWALSPIEARIIQVGRE